MNLYKVCVSIESGVHMCQRPGVLLTGCGGYLQCARAADGVDNCEEK